MTEFGNKIAVQQTKRKTRSYNSKTKTERKHFEKVETQENLNMHNKNGDKASSTRQYNKKLEEFDKLSSIDLENGFDFPSEEVCPYLSIRAKRKEDTAEITTSCKTSRINQSECELTNKYLGKPRVIPPRFCPERKTTRNICWFEKKSRSSIQDTAGLQCGIGMCRDGAVYLGEFDVTHGRVMPDDDWFRLANETALVKAVSDVMTKNYSNHFRYILLCR